MVHNLIAKHLQALHVKASERSNFKIQQALFKTQQGKKSVRNMNLAEYY